MSYKSNTDCVLIESLASKLRNGENITASLPTDIFSWPNLIAALETVEEDQDTLLVKVLWIRNLLMCPFSVFKILSEVDLIKATEYLLDSLDRFTKYSYKKHALKTLSFIARERLKAAIKSYNDIDSSVETAIFNKIEDRFLLFARSVPEANFYCFLKYLAMITDMNGKSAIRKYVKFDSKDPHEDSMQTLRYKVKIISYLTDSESAGDDINLLAPLLVIEDFKLGWTLSKAIFRMSKLLDRNSLICEIMKNLKKKIFADEQLWINSMTIISFLVLDGTTLSHLSLDFINTALKYDSEFFPRSVAVRETALFLLWSSIRSDVNIGDLIYQVIFVSLFDREFKCRRAAACVIQEFLGHFGNDVQDFTLKLITQENIKRRPETLEIFSKIQNKTAFRDNIEAALFSSDRETRKMAACVIARYFDPLNVPVKYKTVPEMDGIHLLIHNCIQFRREDLISHFSKWINTFVLTSSEYKVRNMEFAIESYLRIAEYFNRENFSKNALFLVGRNFNPLLLQETTKCLFISEEQEASEFRKSVLDSIRKNTAGLLINVNNATLAGQVLKQFTANLKNGVYVEQTLMALRLMRHQEKDEAFELAVSYLNDYTVGFDGDSSAVNRTAALEYCIFFVNSSVNHDPDFVDLVERSIIRFLADKSKKLRDCLVGSLLLGQFKEHESVSTQRLINPIPVKIQIYKSEFDKFFEYYTVFSKDNDSEYALFKALSLAFSGFDEYCLGIIQTFNTADGKLRKILTDNLIDGEFNKRVRNLQERKEFVAEIERFSSIDLSQN